MFEQKDVNNLQILLEAFINFKGKLSQVKDTSTGTLNDWISKEITSAELVISSLDYELDKLRSKVDDDILEVEIDGINAQMKVYHEALKGCSDEIEGKLLDKLIELKKAKIELEKKINAKNDGLVKSSNQYNTTIDTDTGIPDDIKEANAEVVDRALEKLDISTLAEELGISLFCCVAELRSTMEEAIKKSYLKRSNEQCNDNILSEEKSEHFLVKVLERNNQLCIQVYVCSK